MFKIEELNNYFEQGLLQKQYHPYHPIIIWNYTAKVQYEQKWDNITINCRGLITDYEGKIIARSFPKFFNIEQIDNNDIPNENFEVYEKMDGSMILLFHYNNEWILASKGSFISDQALKAKELVKKYNINILDKNKSYVFEIIY
jgi:tRNA splicing ligase